MHARSLPREPYHPRCGSRPDRCPPGGVQQRRARHQVPAGSSPIWHFAPRRRAPRPCHLGLRGRQKTWRSLTEKQPSTRGSFSNSCSPISNFLESEHGVLSPRIANHFAAVAVGPPGNGARNAAKPAFCAGRRRPILGGRRFPDTLQPPSSGILPSLFLCGREAGRLRCKSRIHSGAGVETKSSRRLAITRALTSHFHASGKRPPRAPA